MYLRLPSSTAVEGVGAFAFAGWFKIKPTTGNQIILSQRGPVSDEGGEYQLVVMPDGRLRFWMWHEMRYDGDDYTVVRELYSKASTLGGTRINDNGWHHIVVTRTASRQANIYIDGKLDSTSGTRSLWTTSLRPLQVCLGADCGAIATKPDYFSGLMDELALFGRELTASEVSNMYLRAAARLVYHVRACATESCLGAKFGGTATGSNMSDLTNSGISPRVYSLAHLPRSRYFQVRVFLQSIAGRGLTPFVNRLQVPTYTP